MSIRISTSTRPTCPPLSLFHSLSLLLSCCLARFTTTFSSAISIYTIRVWPKMQPVLLHVPAPLLRLPFLVPPFLAFPHHPLFPFLLPFPSHPYIRPSLAPECSLDHEHRYHDRISPSKFPLVRAGSQSNNHLRALHSYLTRRGSRFYTAPTSSLLPCIICLSLSLSLSFSRRSLVFVPPRCRYSSLPSPTCLPLSSLFLPLSFSSLFPLHPPGHVGGW